MTTNEITLERIIEASCGCLSKDARERLLSVRWEPLLLADWERTLMLHYAVDPAVLQPFVPFTLDTHEGLAYVSLVAFTMRDMRLRCAGKMGAWLLRPIATHEFLNVRTYVRHQGESGIHFLAEWLPNKLSVVLGRPAFGLPYRLGKMAYDHQHEDGYIRGRVKAVGYEAGNLSYEGTVPGDFQPSPLGSLTEFLMERYTAFTCWGPFKRLFRVWHEPWKQCAAQIRITENGLSQLTGEWAHQAHYVGANYSPGASNVWMSRPVLC